MRRLAFAIAGLAAIQPAFAQNNPFAPPRATMHYAPDRTCDLIHLRVDLDVDYPNRTFSGHAENTMAPLRDGITQIVVNAGPTLEISKVTLDGRTVTYRHDGRVLTIDTPPLAKGKPVLIAIDYKAVNSRGGSFGTGAGGWHWIQARDGQPTHEGFWTQGESESNENWAPTWDYPNDFTTSETHCTVPADWTVIGNGVPAGNTLSHDGKRRTFVWRMDLPHATYLLSLCGGPFDVTRDTWRGVPLLYVVPKGEGQYSPYTFSGTKDMLSFYSDTLGVKFAWPKYAQDAMFDFGGGMENVSATTMGEGVLTEPREGFRRGDSLISHEMAHQWFGDFVTCMDWGDTWLNESFATFMQMAYFEHSRGKNAYDEEVDNNTRGYLAEARRFERPISTKLYTNPDDMFGSGTTYDKGGVVLHTLRRQLGDAAFWAGLNLYLRTHAHTPVQASQLCRAFTESSGIDCQPFFDQWIFKPGHPTLEYTWDYDDANHAVNLHLKQTQDTSNGTPIYTIPARVGVIVDGKLVRMPFTIEGQQQDHSFTGIDRKPDAVLLDPDHDFLREIRNVKWTPDELRAIMQFAPEGGDRTEAMRELITPDASDQDVQLAVKVLSADRDVFPAFRTISPLSQLKKPELRPFFESQLDHASFNRRLEAVNALALLPADPGTTVKLRALVNDQSPIFVVTAAIRTLADWDAKGNADVFRKAVTFPSRLDRIKHAAQDALGSG